MEKRDTKKSIKHLLLFFILIFITFYIVFRDQNPKEIINVVRHADLRFVFVAIRIYVFIFCL